MKKKPTREEIKEVVDSVFSQPPPKQERQFKLYSYCKGIDGGKNYSTSFLDLCSHPECHNCRTFERLFKEEVNRQLEEFKNKKMKKYKLVERYPSLPPSVTEGAVISKVEERNTFYTLKLPNATFYFTEKEVEDNKFWKLVEYEILASFDKTSRIASVKRLSDGEVFSIKDTLNHGGRILEIVEDKTYFGGIKLIHTFGSTAINGATKMEGKAKTIHKDQKRFSYNDIVKIYNDSNNKLGKINHSFARVLNTMEKELKNDA